MSVDRIPVFLNVGDQTPVGFGKIVDDELVITVRSELLVSSIERLADAGDIKELYLGFGFPVGPAIVKRAGVIDTTNSATIRTRAAILTGVGYSNAEIAEALGLAENHVRIILAN